MIDLLSVSGGLSQIKSSGNEKVNIDSGNIFDGIYKSAVNSIKDTNNLIQDADKISVDFALGKVDNIADVMIAQEKANTALQYTVAVRGKILEAYNEIMRIQV